MKLVLDTDVMPSGLQSSTGASRILLVAAWQGVFVPLASVATMIEYEAILKRPEHLSEMGLEASDVDTFLDNWALLAEPVFPHYSYKAVHSRP